MFSFYLSSARGGVKKGKVDLSFFPLLRSKRSEEGKKGGRGGMRLPSSILLAKGKKKKRGR